LCLWAGCLVWTIGYSSAFGYGADAAAAPLVLGLPSWVFWGIALPWGLAAVVSIVLAVFFIADDDLGEAGTRRAPTEGWSRVSGRPGAGSAGPAAKDDPDDA
jgi:hypothetical protein